MSSADNSKKKTGENSKDSVIGKNIDAIIKKYSDYKLTPVEAHALSQTPYDLIYRPMEKLPVIIVDNFPRLGKLSALRFVEWVQNNPGGVISLPTGKTPEHFIKWVQHYLQNWDKKEVRADLEQNMVDPSKRPDMGSLHFIQIDEFYPMNPQQHNSFYYYVNKYYIRGFGLDPEKAMLLDCSQIGSRPDRPLLELFRDKKVDLTLRYRKPKNYLEKLQKTAIDLADQFCTEYEEKIRALGGIGFFLGGIGPDGHIGFNVRGSDHYSTTRLTHTNYETEASAGGDLGGIEVSRGRLVITIGLSTITSNPEATAIIIAAGEAKSGIVADSIQTEKNNIFPASALQSLPRARFYLTHGAATCLEERAFADLQRKTDISDEAAFRIVMNVGFSTNKSLDSLSNSDLKNDRFAAELLKKTNKTTGDLVTSAVSHINKSINTGLFNYENKVFLHTAPHHDDIMLGYLPYIEHQTQTPTNDHYFAYMTSGFTAVTNSYVSSLLQTMLKYMQQSDFSDLHAEGYFDANNKRAKNTETMMLLDGVARKRVITIEEAQSRRMLRNAMIVFEDDNFDNIKERAEELINYFETQYPGKKDLPYIQKFKGMVREWEADVLWAYFGFHKNSVRHLRLGFYQGDIFTEEPTIDRDVIPILNLMLELKPNIVSLAFDPEGSGPDTHYKVLQAISHALQLYEDKTGITDIEVLGYRNVWFKYHPCEANMYVPVSIANLCVLENSFVTAFASQKDASFPSYVYDGQFSGLARKIQVKQYVMIKDLLKKDHFVMNSDPRLRAAHGMVFLKKMTTKELYEYSRQLKKSTENL
ncbi:MAG: glucosamine-6-phosphate deaminase [Candidatus Auribacterota bacterium]|jgi:glucosamine-6-phosphate deaminase|nr:glucosamine-6-phosphate deaminase [Candidatus Auribacterota bacterium]